MTPEEETWRDDLQRQIAAFRIDADQNERSRALSEMRDIAEKLHKSLKEHGNEPKHHKYMIDNRGVPPEDHDFYFNIHAIQDLIAFTNDPNANNDAVDQTIDHEFTLRVFTRRYRHDDTYTVQRTASGWLLRANLYSGPCDKSCAPLLYDCLRHDSVAYPKDVGEWFEWLWEQAKEKGLQHEDVQRGLDDIANWIEITEKEAPAEGIWKGLA